MIPVVWSGRSSGGPSPQGSHRGQVGSSRCGRPNLRVKDRPALRCRDQAPHRCQSFTSNSGDNVRTAEVLVVAVGTAGVEGTTRRRVDDRRGVPLIGRSRARRSRRCEASTAADPTCRVARRSRRSGRRAALDRLAAVHDHELVSYLGHDPEVVGDDDDRGFHLALQVHEEVEDLGLHGDVQRRCRLVGDTRRGLLTSAIAIIARWRMPPRTRGGTRYRCASAGSGCHLAEHVDDVRARRGLGGRAMVHLVGSMIWLPTEYTDAEPRGGPGRSSRCRVRA